MEKNFTGLLEDPRTSNEKLKDYKAEEVFSSFTPAVWKEKKTTEWKHFPIFDQDGSSSCVGQAVSKALGIENFQEEGDFVHLSARDIYTRRANKPREGMWYIDAMGIACKFGATLEAFMPSQKMNETKLNWDADRKNYKAQTALTFKAGGYVQLSADIEQIASVLAQGNPVLLGFRFTYDEWTDFPTIKNNLKTLGHAVCAVDFTLWKGKKHIIIEDSWGKFGQFEGQRLISADFISKRCHFAGYFLDLSNKWRDGEEQIAKPQYTFKTTMKFEDTSEDVKNLQKILRYEELFPVDVDTTGYYGSITAKGVLAFQRKHKVASDAELDSLQGRLCGGKTLEVLNKLYA